MRNFYAERLIEVVELILKTRMNDKIGFRIGCPRTGNFPPTRSNSADISETDLYGH